MDLNSKTHPLLIIVGMAGSGKSSITTYLQGKNWQVIHFGEITINELKRRNLEINEINEKKIREEIREKHGMGAYAKISLPDIKKALLKGPVVIDGLYSWSEYKTIINEIKNPIIIVAIFTPRKLRYERLSKRDIRPLTYKEAEQRDIAEIEKIEKGGPIAIADYTIINDGKLEKLYLAIDNILKEILS